MTAPDTLPEAWQGELSAQLAPDEQLLAWHELDLDDRLDFRPGLLVLTNQRLLATAAGSSAHSAWPLTADLTLFHHDNAGVATLELENAAGRLARWRYTLGRNPAALRFEREFSP